MSPRRRRSGPGSVRQGLGTAAQKCAGGFTATIGGERTRFFNVAADAAPQVTKLG
ncbi:hypothetical protein ACF1BB_06200 [Streptomyces griseoluteus]|uniref:hypothetical protein n=1 Tax=Streptomyces griseoluteus TaxID=29306 RepID=UPI0036FF284C